MAIRILFLIFSICPALAYSASIEQTSIEAKVLWHSYVQKVGGQLVADDTRVSDLVNIDAESQIIQDGTWVIPNKLGTGFDISVAFRFIPREVEHFDLHVSFPKMELPTGEIRSEINRPIDIQGHDGTHVWGFTFYFDMPYEANPGDWVFKIRSKGNLLHQSTFQVVESSK